MIKPSFARGKKPKKMCKHLCLLCRFKYECDYYLFKKINNDNMDSTIEYPFY